MRGYPIYSVWRDIQLKFIEDATLQLDHILILELEPFQMDDENSRFTLYTCLDGTLWMAASLAVYSYLLGS